MSHPGAKGECSQPGDEVGDQSEISVSKRVQGLGLSPRTSEMDMTLAMNFRVDTGDPQRRGEVTGPQELSLFFNAPHPLVSVKYK